MVWVVIFLIFLAYNPLLWAKEHLIYRTVISGDISKSIKKEISENIETLRLEDKEIVISEGILKAVMVEDKTTIEKIMRSYGYYSPKISLEIKKTEEGYIAEFGVEPGPQFVFDIIEVSVKGQEKAFRDTVIGIMADAGVAKGLPCETKAILKGEEEVIKGIKNLGFPFPKIQDRQYIVDYTKNGMDVKYEIDPGPRGHFGRLLISGLDKTKYEYLERMLSWKEGEIFSLQRLEQLQRALYQSNLFSTVNIKTKERLDEGSKLDVIAEVKERKYRSIAGGISYRTYEGPGISFGWEDSNLQGSAERLAFKGALLSKTYYQRLEYMKPFLGGRPQDLALSLQNKKEEGDAYDATTLSWDAMVNVPRWKRLSLSYGVSAKYGKVTQSGSEDSYSLISLPLRLGRSKVDDLLNPSHGYRAFLNINPSYLIPLRREFLKVYSGGSVYVPLSEDRSYLFAAKLNMGFIGNLSRDTLPADERFYGGGDGSVRGYAYQYLGELRGGTPVGGKGLMEFGGELRKRIRERLGLVVFLDGGSVYRSYPMDGSGAFRFGTGLGLRFVTPVGPIRLDVATPLNRRAGVDRYIAVYFSVGQAF